MLYQLSYFRKFRFSVPRRAVSAKIYRIGATPLARRRFAATSEGFATPTGFLKWEVMDSNHRRRTPADLQSAPFDRSGNFPFFLLRGGVVPPGLSDQGSVFIADSAFKSSEVHSPLLFSGPGFPASGLSVLRLFRPVSSRPPRVGFPSRWRDSNPRPADYKSAALAN